MVLGIVALVIPFVGIVTGPLAIIFSTKAKKEMRFNGEGGNGLATAGLVTGILGCAGYALFLLLMVVGAMGSTAGGV
ncbi:DUF4190 domain-containing protein [Streptomyces sp. TRM66268-LWL]|uniref:DUF4190 domain-containing protein n=2 Tax=Streptomyces polyasparticus TaxID=2767826 RepID=A0ABR7SC77_9ACTN|nr:DUF4190 domain-containing protein [Streptomyces polyasparticus]